jgi:hypothetical protein
MTNMNYILARSKTLDKTGVEKRMLYKANKERPSIDVMREQDYELGSF